MTYNERLGMITNLYLENITNMEDVHLQVCELLDNLYDKEDLLDSDYLCLYIANNVLYGSFRLLMKECDDKDLKM